MDEYFQEEMVQRSRRRTKGKYKETKGDKAMLYRRLAVECQFIPKAYFPLMF